MKTTDYPERVYGNIREANHRQRQSFKYYKDDESDADNVPYIRADLIKGIVDLHKKIFDTLCYTDKKGDVVIQSYLVDDFVECFERLTKPANNTQQ